MIDPRGPRFAAWLTTAVLAAVLLTGSTLLLAGQALVFALGSRGRSPYAVLYARLLAPRLGPPSELEDVRPVRFAQSVGLVFTVAALLAYVAGAPALGTAAVSAALAAAFLNAAFGFCLGCEAYLLYTRTTTKGASA